MNVSYQWLRDMLPGLSLDPDALAEHLALRGAPVESASSPARALADVVVARVEAAGPHPNADRLSLCTVEAGAGPVSVVCGAPNVRAGGCYPFAPVGAVLPGDFRIKKAKIRGEVSEGMLCSPKELGLGTDHAGILEIEGDFEPGQSFVDALGLDDTTLDVEITTNRGDLLSHVGVARELASEADGEVRLVALPDAPDPELSYERADGDVTVGDVQVRIECPELCHRYLAAVIRGVRVGPSPEWLQRRLRGAGARPINNVVDATNYVMLELGQPLHAFDLARLAGPAIVVRRPAQGERRFTTLDGEERVLGDDMCMICDADRPVAVGGVMGGLDSEVEPETTDVLLECALFEPGSINRTRRKLQMSTDASYRFERGVDPAGMEVALERAVRVILATAGGSVDGAVLDCCPKPHEPSSLSLRMARIEHVLGVPFDADTVRALLAPLGFEVGPAREGVLEVVVPGFRSYDVTREIDLIEEVARTHGYDRFPSELGPYRPSTVPDDPLFELEDRLRRALVAHGLYEAQTPAFVAEGEGEVRVANPLTTTEPFMRSSLLPSLLRRAEHNLARGNGDVRLFEMGTAFRAAEKGEPPHEEIHLAAVLVGRRRPPHWSVPDEELDVWDLKAVLEEAAAVAHAGGAGVAPAGDPAPQPFDRSSAFTVRLASGDIVGAGGRVTEAAVDLPAWAGSVWGFELALPADAAGAPVVTYRPLPRHPAVERDLALVVPSGVAAVDVHATITERAGAILEHLELFDRFTGEGIPEGARSLAFRLRFRAAERTLKDEEVDRTVAAVVRRLEEEMGVEHRG